MCFPKIARTKSHSRSTLGRRPYDLLAWKADCKEKSNQTDDISPFFAFALYDKLKKKLYLVRDRIGEKPLYYGFIGDGFVFASELIAIEQLDCFDAVLDQEALALYFKYSYIPAPYSIYDNIFYIIYYIAMGITTYQSIIVGGSKITIVEYLLVIMSLIMSITHYILKEKQLQSMQVTSK